MNFTFTENRKGAEYLRN